MATSPRRAPTRSPAPLENSTPGSSEVLRGQSRGRDWQRIHERRARGGETRFMLRFRMLPKHPRSIPQAVRLEARCPPCPRAHAANIWEKD